MGVLRPSPDPQSLWGGFAHLLLFLVLRNQQLRHVNFKQMESLVTMHIYALLVKVDSLYISIFFLTEVHTVASFNPSEGLLALLLTEDCKYFAHQLAESTWFSWRLFLWFLGSLFLSLWRLFGFTCLFDFFFDANLFLLN